MEISLNGKDFTLDVMTVVLIAVNVLLLVLLYKAQTKNDNFDLRDLIMEKKTGKVSLSRFGQLIALLVSTWGFVTLTLHDKLTEWYYASYMMIWAAAEGFRKWGDIELNKKQIDAKKKEDGNEPQAD
jgi:hypothetical protein